MHSGIIEHTRAFGFPVPITVAQVRQSSCSTDCAVMPKNGRRQPRGYLRPIASWPQSNVVMGVASKTLRTCPGRLLSAMP